MKLISLELGEGFDWVLAMDEPTVMEKITLDEYKNSQQIYRAVNLGTVKITGVGNRYVLSQNLHVEFIPHYLKLSCVL